jgi:hypothetical protein
MFIDYIRTTGRRTRPERATGISIMATNKKSFDDVVTLAIELQYALAKYNRILPMLEKASRALVTASETTDVQLARGFLGEALDAAKDGLAEMDKPELATNVGALETAAD